LSGLVRLCKALREKYRGYGRAMTKAILVGLHRACKAHAKLWEKAW
jgi:hypothetical protein|tara:strand:- start:3052 stop:3189 length:138 start_codon:yes stop_codon:yes gene_type:complete